MIRVAVLVIANAAIDVKPTRGDRRAPEYEPAERHGKAAFDLDEETAAFALEALHPTHRRERSEQRRSDHVLRKLPKVLCDGAGGHAVFLAPHSVYHEDVRVPGLPFSYRPALVLGLSVALLGWSDNLGVEHEVFAPHIEPLHFIERGQARARIDGSSFPDGVIALTWDDGPDTGTLALARFLRSQGVSATFFVVGEWREGISEEPGKGARVFATGYEHLPILGTLVGLGHRLGNHTRNHALLWGAPPSTVAEQLARAQADIDPYLVNELRIFRTPGGAFDRTAEHVTRDPLFSDVRGPIHWDIDRKDWEGSVYCRATDPSECTNGRVRPSVIAKRYLAAIESARHGIVLLHDRVGDVGSTYALDVARQLVPALAARGFVFAPPILGFSPLSERLAWQTHVPTHFADVDGDGHADVCIERVGMIACRAAKTSPTGVTHIPRTSFGARDVIVKTPIGMRAFSLGDVDGDGRADLCAVLDHEVVCARATGAGFGSFEAWSRDLSPAKSHLQAISFRLADIDGDGRADACARTSGALLCAKSTGHGFAPPRVWLTGIDPRATIELADVSGGGRADACLVSPRDVTCALSTGDEFVAPHKWIELPLHGVRFGDLNGDGRSDLCMTTREGVACALSNGHAFTRATTWLTSEEEPKMIALADVNGDHRTDLCVPTTHGVSCGMAP